MQTAENQGPPTGINYDDAPIAQEQIEDVEYRIDAGRGTAVAISTRQAGTWTWAPVTEGRWDGVQLKAKSLGHPVVSVLARALATAMSERGAE